MAKNDRGFTLDSEPPAAPLTEAEKAAIERAKADVAAGRLHDHEDVAARLRRRAAEIVARARKASSIR